MIEQDQTHSANIDMWTEVTGADLCTKALERISAWMDGSRVEQRLCKGVVGTMRQAMVLYWTKQNVCKYTNSSSLEIAYIPSLPWVPYKKKGQDARTIDMISWADHACSRQAQDSMVAKLSIPQTGLAFFFGSWHPKKQKVRDFVFLCTALHQDSSQWFLGEEVLTTGIWGVMDRRGFE